MQPHTFSKLFKLVAVVVIAVIFYRRSIRNS